MHTDKHRFFCRGESRVRPDETTNAVSLLVIPVLFLSFPRRRESITHDRRKQKTSLNHGGHGGKKTAEKILNHRHRPRLDRGSTQMDTDSFVGAARDGDCTKNYGFA